VIWENSQSHYFEREGRRNATTFVMIFIVLFWSVITAVVSQLTNIDTISQNLPALGNAINSNPSLAGFISGVLPPLVIAILMSLVPMILRTLSTYSGAPLKTIVERLTLSQYFFFLIFNVLVVVTISGSIVTSISNIIKDPTSVLDILSKQIPLNSTFFITYLLVLGLSGPTAELVQLSQFFLRPIMVMILGNTPRTLYDINKPPTYYYSTAMATHGLITVIGLTYCIISPLLNIFVCMYFALYTFTYLYMMQYVYMQEFETGGLFLYTCSRHMFTGLYILRKSHVFSMISTLVSKLIYF
jgi:calcium permeable stress-gated cation channel